MRLHCLLAARSCKFGDLTRCAVTHLVWMQVCFKCGQKGHWAADCTASTSLATQVDLKWCVSSSAVLDADAPPLPPVLRPEAAQRCMCNTAAASSTAGAGCAESGASDALLQLLQKEFGHEGFRDFQLPVVKAILGV